MLNFIQSKVKMNFFNLATIPDFFKMFQHVFTASLVKFLLTDKKLKNFVLIPVFFFNKELFFINFLKLWN